MKLSIQREELLKPLQLAAGVVEKKQTMPILSNVLINIEGDSLSVTGSDLEVELIGKSKLQTPVIEGGEITVPGRKLLDICRSLPSDATLNIEVFKDRMTIKAGKSRFSLATLPASDYPSLTIDDAQGEFSIAQNDLLFLAQRTHFAMAQQDVRYYLNGMLLEVNPKSIRTVATDGHRLATSALNIEGSSNAKIQALIPRKGVLELMRLLDDDETAITFSVSENHIRAQTPNFTFTSKLIDASYPNYDRVIPKNGDKIIEIQRGVLKSSLQRASILSNEKYRGIRLSLDNNKMSIEANNPEQEEANEELAISYDKNKLELGFNVDYLVDVLNTVSNENVELTFSNNDQGVLIVENADNWESIFVVMPMRL